MNRFINIYLFLISIILTACIEDVDEKYYPKSEAKLVMFCEINEKDSIPIIITRTTPASYNELIEEDPYSYNQINFVEDAIVKVINNNTNQEIIASFDDNSNSYYIDQTIFPFINGEKYSIRVEAENFKSIESTIFIRDQRNIEADFNTQVIDLNDMNSKLLVSGELNDFKGEDNYYLIEVFYYGSDYYPSYYRTIVSDKNKVSKIPFRMEMYYDSQLKFDSLTLFISDIDYHYYMYLNSLENQSNGPFTEPTPVYSNIKNGLGIFTSVFRNKFEKVIIGD